MHAAVVAAVTVAVSLSFPLAVAPPSALATDFEVNSPGDESDDNVADTICSEGDFCTLRAAIEQSNAPASPDADTISFALGVGELVISPATPLPTITDPVTIDGTTQLGYTGTPLVRIDGAATASGNGLTIAAGASTVKALAITGFPGHGIELLTGGANSVLSNNIGMTGGGLGNDLDGVHITSGSSNVIGGTGPRNVIRSNLQNGVSIADGALNRVQDNAIFDNGALAVNLGADGPLANDSDDIDSGPNAGQNFPVLIGANSSEGTSGVRGQLDSAPNTSYRVEFFSQAACDPSLHGEAQVPRGAVDVSTDSLGHAIFSAALAGEIAHGEQVTATATTPGGSTSELSRCAEVEQTPTVGIAAVQELEEGNSGVTDVTFIVQLSRPTAQEVKVDVTTANHTAQEPGDYQAAAATVTIDPGKLNAPFIVKVQGDTTPEPEETFEIRLSNPVHATLPDARSKGTIRDDDPAPPPPGPDPDAPTPPLPTGDGDGDRSANALDLCPGTPQRTRVVRRGCSLLQLVTSPTALLDSSAASVRDALAAIRAQRDLGARGRRLGAGLTRGLRTIQRAAPRLAGNPCAAARAGRRGVAQASTAARGIATLVRTEQRDVLGQATRFSAGQATPRGDADQFDVRHDDMTFARTRTGEALAELRGAHAVIAQVCRRSGPARRVTGRVLEIDNAAGVARLTGGRSLTLSTAGKAAGIAPGVTVGARGRNLAGALGGAAVFVATQIAANAKRAAAAPCAFALRIAPVQEAPDANLTFHDERGYRNGNEYLLEGGMRIGATLGEGCAPTEERGRKLTRTLNVSLDLSRSRGTVQLLGALTGTPGEAPVAITKRAGSAEAVGTLLLELVTTDCSTAQDVRRSCRPPSISTTSFGARVRLAGWAGRALYQDAVFSVPDRLGPVGSEFDTTQLRRDFVSADLPGAKLAGIGYAAIPFAGATGLQFFSTFPATAAIPEDALLAVHAPVKRPRSPAGLLFAYVTGSRGGHPYSYVADLPTEVATDRLSSCEASTTNAFYKLPYTVGIDSLIAQGNQGTFSHAPRNSIDFDRPLNDPILAARGGIVIDVVEHHSEQSHPADVKSGKKLRLPSNAVVIEHQDGTRASYKHMPENGVVPKKGDPVVRGDVIAKIGVTGYTSGPHLHWTAVDDDAAENDPARGTLVVPFEGVVMVLPFSTLGPLCVVPQQGLTYRSTNAGG